MPTPRSTGDQQALDTMLIQATEFRDIESVKQHLGQGPSIEMQDEKGRTVLIAAAYRNNLPIANLLIEAGADVSLADSKGITPLVHASQGGYQQIKENLSKQPMLWSDVQIDDLPSGCSSNHQHCDHTYKARTKKKMHGGKFVV